MIVPHNNRLSLYCAFTSPSTPLQSPDVPTITVLVQLTSVQPLEGTRGRTRTRTSEEKLALLKLPLVVPKKNMQAKPKTILRLATKEGLRSAAAAAHYYLTIPPSPRCSNTRTRRNAILPSCHVIAAAEAGLAFLEAAFAHDLCHARPLALRERQERDGINIRCSLTLIRAR